MIVRQRDQMMIEKPVNGAGQCQSVLDHIGTTVSYRKEVSRVHFGIARSVQNAKSSDCTSVVVCLVDARPKAGVSHYTVHERPHYDFYALVGWKRTEKGRFR